MNTTRPLALSRIKLSDSSPEEVMGLLLDPRSWPRWQPEVVSADGPHPLRTHDVARGRARMLGFAVHGHSTTVGAGVDHFEQDVIVGVRMRIRYEVEPAGSGSAITHQLECDLPGGASGRFLSFFLRGRLQKLQTRALSLLAGGSD
jgi:Polyketide cyclase / dehydrase and lipid transport